MTDNIDEVFDIGFGRMTADQDIMDTGFVPTQLYADAEQFALEKEIFGQVWLNVAEVSEIPNPGDWIVREVPIRSVSMILMRGKDGVIRAFHNVCSHRGMRLAWDKRGKGGKLACRYHAWIYDSQGELAHVPDPACFPLVQKSENGLPKIHCDTWEGFVFINLSETPRQSLLEFLGPVAERIRNAPFDTFPVACRMNSTTQANWKFVQDGQIEGYHAVSLHARTVGRMVVTEENPHNRPIDWEPLGAHRQQAVQVNLDYRPIAGRHVQSFAAHNSTHILVDDSNRTGAGFADLPGVNKSKSNNWAVEQFSVYPNFVIHISTGGWFYHRFWPIDATTTHWEVVYHFRAASTLREKFSNEFNLAFNRDTLTEDHVASEQQQVQLASNMRPFIIFGDKTEMLSRHFEAVNASASNAVDPRRAEAAE